MTYEKFASSMTEVDSADISLTRKDIKNFAIRYGLLLFLSAFFISTVISSIIGSIFSVAFIILAVLLYICSFDVFVENVDCFIIVNKIAKFWLLIDVIVAIACVVINSLI